MSEPCGPGCAVAVAIASVAILAISIRCAMWAGRMLAAVLAAMEAAVL